MNYLFSFVLAFSILLISPMPAFAITKGDVFNNVTVNLVSTDETGTGVIYTPQCLAECHLPVKFFYDGILASSSKTINVSNRQNIDWLFQNTAAGDDIHISDVRVLMNLNASRNVTKYSLFNRTYTKLSNDTVPEGCSEITSTSYWCFRPEPNGTMPITEIVKEWVSIKNEAFILNKSTIYYLDFVGRRTPKLGAFYADAVPSLLDFSFSELAWWNTTWLACRNITVNSGQVAGFIHRIELNTTTINYSKTAANGSDLRIVPGNCSSINANAVEEDFAIAYWNTSAKSILLVNSSVGSNRYFALYYNNSGATRFWNITSTIVDAGKRNDFNNETLGERPAGWTGLTATTTNTSAYMDNKYLNATGTDNWNQYLVLGSYPYRWGATYRVPSFATNNEVWGQWSGANTEWVFGSGSNASSFCDDIAGDVRGYGQVLSTNTDYWIEMNITSSTTGALYINGESMENCTNLNPRGSTTSGVFRAHGQSTSFYTDSIVIYNTNNSLNYTISAEETPSSACTGTISTTLLSPASNTELQRNQTFALKVNVSCTGGCCGIVTGTADPQAAEFEAPLPAVPQPSYSAVAGILGIIAFVGIALKYKAMI